ncbi:MAG TPA: hypothetical protein VF867_16565 [Arthrobacter sp.]
MSEQQHTEEQGLRPLDSFDPTPDGVSPYTLGETVDAAVEVLQSLHRFQLALAGCMTPLALEAELKQTRKVAVKASGWAETLARARDIIEGDLPLADTVRVQLPEFDCDLPWDEMVLSPADIVAANTGAAGLPLERLTTYRREIERVPRMPSVIASRRERAAKQARKAASERTRARVAKREPKEL